MQINLCCASSLFTCPSAPPPQHLGFPSVYKFFEWGFTLRTLSSPTCESDSCLHVHLALLSPCPCTSAPGDVPHSCQYLYLGLSLGPVPSPPSPLAIWDTGCLLLLAWLDPFPNSGSVPAGLGVPMCSCRLGPLVLLWRGRVPGEDHTFHLGYCRFPPDVLCLHACVCKRGTLKPCRIGSFLCSPHGAIGFLGVISGFRGVTPPVKWEVPQPSAQRIA